MLKFKISAKILEDYILRVLKFLNNMTYIYLDNYLEYLFIDNKCLSYLKKSFNDKFCSTHCSMCFTNQMIVFVTNLLQFI